MYEELVKSLREKAEFLNIANGTSDLKNSFAEAMREAADGIEAMCEMVANTYRENANLIASIEENKSHYEDETENIPSDEVETVIHCADCKWLSFKDFMGVCGRGKVNGFVWPDSYCSWGELREEKAKQNDRK